MVIGRKKIYYGWIIVAVGVIMMMSYGIVNNCISLYVVPICSELGFTRKAGAFMSTLYSAGGMLVSAVSSSLYQAMPVKKSMRVAAVTLSAAYFCYFFADKLWQFYIISAVAGCAMWLLAYVPYAIILSNWFHKRTGFVIGLTYMGTGIGGMLFSPVVGRLIETVGWRECFAIMSIIVAFAVIPGSFIVRDKPEEKGLLPYGERNADEAARHISEPEGMYFHDIIRSPRFYAIAIGLSALSFVNTGFAGTFAAYMSDLGYPISVASAVVSGNMASLAVGKISLGWIYDKLGNIAGTALSGAFLAGAVVAGLLMPGTLPIICEIALFSLGFAFGSVAIPIISMAAFGERSFSRVNGTFMAVTGIAAAMGPVFSGHICDTTGSYAGSYRAYVVIAAVFTVVIILCLAKSKERTFNRT